MPSVAHRINFFRMPLLVLVAGVVFAFWVGGPDRAFIVAVLVAFEVAMSFNNAVINATVLRHMDWFWQRMFLTVGILVAVVGVRLVLPIVLVMVTAGLSARRVVDLVLHNPAEYGHHLQRAHPSIAGFGGMFLLMLFLDFLINESKRVHWIGIIERPLARAGRVKALSVLIGLVLLWTMSQTLAGGESKRVLIAGTAGLVTYLAVRWLSQAFAGIGVSGRGRATGWAAVMLFLYLEILDASFSFDGVVGAFAITNNVFTITLGLGIGALFVRELTVWLVRNNTLSEFIYLEHGAQYSVGALAVLLALGLVYNIPDVVTGLVGVVFVVMAVLSSIAEQRRA